MFGAAGFWAHRSLQAEVERRVGDDMKAVLDTAVNGVGAFLQGAERLAALVAEAPEVRAAAAGQRSDGQRARPVRAGGQADRLRGRRARAASSSSRATGSRRWGRRSPAEVFPAVVTASGGGPRAGLPFRALDGRVRIMVVVALPGGARVSRPRHRSKRALGAACWRRGPGERGRPTPSTAQGVMISSSRFPQHLRGAGLIGPDEDDSALRVAIRDPGGDMTEGFRARDAAARAAADAGGGRRRRRARRCLRDAVPRLPRRARGGRLDLGRRARLRRPVRGRRRRGLRAAAARSSGSSARCSLWWR